MYNKNVKEKEFYILPEHSCFLFKKKIEKILRSIIDFEYPRINFH